MTTAKIVHIVILHVTVIVECLCANDMLRMCYFHAGARYRRTKARFDSSDIDFSLCTHYVYAYGRIDHPPNTISPMDPGTELGDTGAYRHFTTRYVSSTSNPKRLLSIGGPNVTADNAFIALTRFESNMRTFSRNAITFIRQHRFTGLDIDWQYPSTPQNRVDLVRLLQILRQDFDQARAGGRLLLTVKCPGVYNSIGYHVPGISSYADYVILAAYNLTSASPRSVSFGSPLYSSHVSVNGSVGEWLLHGLAASKTVVGISAVGRLEVLVNELEFTPGAPVRDVHVSGYLYNISHGLAYPEVCDMLVNARAYFDHFSQMHFAVLWNMWVGYEDTESINSKECGLGTHPLLKSIIRSIRTPTAPALATTRATTTAPSTRNITERTEDSTQSVQDPGLKDSKDSTLETPDHYYYEYMIVAFVIFLVAYVVCCLVTLFTKRKNNHLEGNE